MAYGQELILDLHNCDIRTFFRESLDELFARLCDATDMQQCERHFWDDIGVPDDEKQTSPHTKGTSAIQFILTSNITIHTLDDLACVYLNLFSCKTFDPDVVCQIAENHFKGTAVSKIMVIRE